MIAATGGDIVGLWLTAVFVWGFLAGAAFATWMHKR